MRHIFAIFVSDGVTSFLSIDRWEKAELLANGWQEETNNKDLILFHD